MSGAGSFAGRLVKQLKSTDWKAKAKQAAETVKAEYEAGKAGDDAPAATIWASPREQLDSVMALLKSSAAEPAATERELEADADEVAVALQGVDWTNVRQATADRTGDATRAMRQMAERVDWSKVQPVAAQVSSALIAAVATGQLGLGGGLGSKVVRTMVNQGGLAQKVVDSVHSRGDTIAPPDFRQIIDVPSG